jgi:hypothetical protein
MDGPVREDQPAAPASDNTSSRRWWPLAIVGLAVLAAGVVGIAGLLPGGGPNASAETPIGESVGFPPTIWVGAPAELAPLFDLQVSRGRGQRGEHGSYLQYDIGHDGQLVVETGYVGQELPPTVPARRDLEADRYDEGGSWPGRELARGDVVADVAVDCVRVVVTVNGTAAPDPAATATLADTIEERVASWLAHTDDDEVCARVQP